MACTFTFQVVIVILVLNYVCCEDNKKVPEKKEWNKKDIRDYSDADMERLFDQWEDADEDELEADELPEWKREPPKVELSDINMDDPEGMLKATKKGRSLMLFASVSGNPTEKETETITQIWQGSLFNANFETQRYIVGENRVIFMLKDGSSAWDVKDFLVKQDRCEEVTIEGKSYPGKAATKENKDEKKKKQKKDSKKDSNDNKTSQKSTKEKDKKDNKSNEKSNKTKDKKDKKKKDEL